MRFNLSTLFFLISVSLYSQESTDDLRLYDRIESIAEDNIFKSDDYYNWGASIIKDQRGYHLFYSRWKKSYGFFGWLTHSEIAHATSKYASGPWKYKETVLSGYVL